MEQKLKHFQVENEEKLQKNQAWAQIDDMIKKKDMKIKKLSDEVKLHKATIVEINKNDDRETILKNFEMEKAELERAHWKVIQQKDNLYEETDRRLK